MNAKKKFLGVFFALVMTMMRFPMPIEAEEMITYRTARWNNIATATLTIGFDSNNIGYFGISVNPYYSCTGLSGQMRLLDENGNLLASWAVYDDVEPYAVERTYQCQEGRTYTLTFQGYAYGDGTTQFDDIVLSVSDTCE